MKFILACCVFIVSVIASMSPVPAQSAIDKASSQIYMLKIEGMLSPVYVKYLEEQMAIAEEHQAALVILQVNTPGGVLKSGQDIAKRVARADVPVVVYATSEGVPLERIGLDILAAGHIKAMAPGTLSESPAGDPAVPAVDIIAASLNDVIAQIQGRRVTLHSGDVRQLDLATAQSIEAFPSVITQILAYISEPNVVIILLMIGFCGLVLESFMPLTLIAGIAGIISLAAAFYGFSVLPISIFGALMVFVALICLLIEIFIISAGFAAIAGMVLLGVGLSYIFDEAQLLGVSLSYSVLYGVMMAAFSLVIIGVSLTLYILTREEQDTLCDDLIDKTAEVLEWDAQHYQGYVFVRGERWAAVGAICSPQPQVGDQVTITAHLKGLRLKVKKL